MSARLSPGFADAPRAAQAVFKALMWALARPGQPQALEGGLVPPAPLTPELAAIALTMLDHDSAVWLDPTLRGAPDVLDFLRFHTSARVVDDPQEAQFALIRDAASAPDFAAFAQGDPAYPDQSTTLVLAVDALLPGPIVMSGPGIDGTIAFGATPLPPDMAARLVRNRTGFPLGVDLLLAAPGAVLGLPRSVRVMEEV